MRLNGPPVMPAGRLLAMKYVALAFTIPAALAVFTSSQSAAESPLLLEKPRQDLTPQDLERVIAVTRPASDFSKAEPFEAMSAGAATSTALPSEDAFSQFSPNITSTQQEEFKLGNALFSKLWVAAPSSTQASDGLGPLYNARSCLSCHVRDGRGHPPEGSAETISMFLRLARPAATSQEAALVADHRALNFPDPVYGAQLQDLAVPGLAAEGRMQMSYTELPVALKDGSTASLRKPHYSVSDLGYGPLGADTTLSPRIAPAMIGLGIVEAIPEADIMAHADPDDSNRDGISGKPAIVRDHLTGKLALGRFGWKAQNATVRDQVSAAFSGDLGLSTPDRPDADGDCTALQTECHARPNGVQPRLGTTEAPDPVMALVTFYSSNLAVPQRREVSLPDVLKGKATFYNLGCASCHVPKFVTSRQASDPSQAFQLIWPYSDFLLHDMGEGLADGQTVGEASGQEWRTPPLWGIGLTQTVSKHSFFLHDGRARNLTEAILWHGGEAQKSRNGFVSLETSDREALLKFLESL